GERPGRAHGDAARLEPSLDAVEAKRALVDVTLRVDEPRVVRTRCDTGLAARTLAMRDEDDAALVDVARAGRAALHAGGVGAVIAPFRSDLGRELRELTAHVFHDPVAA